MRIMNFTASNGAASKCGISVLTGLSTIAPVIVATELPDNPGMSITNAIEQVMRAAVEKGFGGYKDVTFIEHYPKASPNDSATFDHVTFGPGFTSPKWKRMTTEELVELIGEAAINSFDEESNKLREGGDKPNKGKCRVCGRRLTNPAHAAKGIGPVCASKSPGA